MATKAQATTTATNEASASSSDEHGFDAAAFERRLRTELIKREIPFVRDESIHLARLFASRARVKGVVVENMFAHPLWVHVAAQHDDKQQSRVAECKACGLLWSHWLV